LAALLLIIFALFHISYNWRGLINYTKNAKGRFVGKETLTAFALMLFIIGLIASRTFLKK
jgi:hypothetical protein